MSAVTDTKRPLKSDPGHPEACNVCQLHKLVNPDYKKLWESERNATTGCADLKRALAERLTAHYAPARELPLVTETMREVKERVGLA
jgi:tryptophanyl-tRNA synthetase